MLCKIETLITLAYFFAGAATRFRIFPGTYMTFLIADAFSTNFTIVSCAMARAMASSCVAFGGNSIFPRIFPLTLRLTKEKGQS